MKRAVKLFVGVLCVFLIFTGGLVSVGAIEPTPVPRTETLQPEPSSPPQNIAETQAPQTPAPETRDIPTSIPDTPKPADIQPSPAQKSEPKKSATPSLASIAQQIQTSARPVAVPPRETAAGTAQPVNEPVAKKELPEVDPAEILYPEVVASRVKGTRNLRANLIGIAAWGCILLGVIIILLVMLRGRGGSGFSGPARQKSKKKRSKHLLPDKYYKSDKF